MYYSKLEQELSAFIKMLTENLKTKEKPRWLFTKVVAVAVAYGSGCLREIFITEFKWHVKRGFTMLVVTGAGRLRGWSQGELWL